jgi:Ran GTPase-activating protein (RanGAP) involved in mRNA processing and transport
MGALEFGDGPKAVHRGVSLRRRRGAGGIRRFREKYRALKKEEVGKDDGINHWEDVQAVVALSCHVAQIIKEVEERMDSTKGAASLDLSNTYLGDAGAKVIAETIEEDYTVASLKFGLNGFKSRGLRVLANAIAANHNITALGFSKSRSVGLQGFWALASALENHPSLTHLDLSYNTMGNEGAKAFGWITFNADRHSKEAITTNLTSLDLAGNCIGDSAVSVLADVLLGESPPINTLKLGYNEIGHAGATALGKALRIKTRVQDLDLQMNRLQV